MTNINELLEDDLDLDDEDDEYLWDEDYFEVSDFPQSVKDRFPGFHLMKITNFNGSKLVDVDAWCQDNVKYGKWERVGWRSGCSSSVGVVIENPRDAMMFKLRWG